MGETLEIIKERRSVRGYKADMVPKDVLDKIIEAGTYAATGMGRQSPIIISVSNKELRDKLSAMNAKIMGKEEGFDPFYGAPNVLIVLADKTMPTYLYDGSLVMGNPAKIKRNLTWEEKLGIMENSKEYLTVSEEMKNQEIL